MYIFLVLNFFVLFESFFKSLEKCQYLFSNVFFDRVLTCDTCGDTPCSNDAEVTQLNCFGWLRRRTIGEVQQWFESM